MKRAALYMRVSTLDQHPETQLYDLRGLAAQRGFEIVEEYADRISGAKARRPGLDQMLKDARQRGSSTSCWSGPATGSPARSGTSSKCSTS